MLSICLAQCRIPSCSVCLHEKEKTWQGKWNGSSTTTSNIQPPKPEKVVWWTNMCCCHCQAWLHRSQVSLWYNFTTAFVDKSIFRRLQWRTKCFKEWILRNFLPRSEALSTDTANIMWVDTSKQRRKLFYKSRNDCKPSKRNPRRMMEELGWVVSDSLLDIDHASCIPDAFHDALLHYLELRDNDGMPSGAVHQCTNALVESHNRHKAVPFAMLMLKIWLHKPAVKAIASY